MKQIAWLLLSTLIVFSNEAWAQALYKSDLQQYLQNNSKLYAVFNARTESQYLSSKMLQALDYRIASYSVYAGDDDIVKSKGLLFCAEVGAGKILVKGKLYGCEVFDIQEQKVVKNNFLWAYSFDFKLKSEKSKVLIGFKNILNQGVTVLKLDELLALSGTVGLTVGYAWGNDYDQSKDLTLRKGFLATQFEVVNGWGAGFKILAPNKTQEKIQVVLGSVLYGDESTELGSQVVIRFRKSIQLKSLVNSF